MALAACGTSRPSVWDKLDCCNELKLIDFEYVYAGSKIKYHPQSDQTRVNLSKVIAPFVVSKSFAHPDQLRVAMMSSAASIKFSQLQHFLPISETFPVASSRIQHLAFVTSRTDEGSWDTRQDIIRSFKDFISKQTFISYCPRLETLELVLERPALCDFMDGILVADAQKAMKGTLTRVPVQRSTQGWSSRVSDYPALTVTGRAECIVYKALVRYIGDYPYYDTWANSESCHTAVLRLLSDAKKKDLEILLTVNVAFYDDVETVPRNYQGYERGRLLGTSPAYTGWTMSSKDWLLRAKYRNKQYAFHQAFLRDIFDHHERGVKPKGPNIRLRRRAT